MDLSIEADAEGRGTSRITLLGVNCGWAMARPHKTKTFLSLCNDCPSMSEFGQQLKLSSNLHTSTVAHTHEHTVVKLNLAGLLRITPGKGQSLSLVEFIFTDPHTCQVRSLLWRDDNAFPGLRSTGSPIPSIYPSISLFLAVYLCSVGFM